MVNIFIQITFNLPSIITKDNKPFFISLHVLMPLIYQALRHLPDFPKLLMLRTFRGYSSMGRCCFQVLRALGASSGALKERARRGPGRQTHCKPHSSCRAPPRASEATESLISMQILNKLYS